MGENANDRHEGDDRLRRSVERESRRIERAEREREGLLALTAYLGTVAVLFLLPVVAGAYLGSWLDDLSARYSSRWTVSLIVLGVALGALNVYLFIRERR